MVYNIITYYHTDSLIDCCLCLVTSVYRLLLNEIPVHLVLLEPSVMMDCVVSLIIIKCSHSNYRVEEF